jgi:RHS repeat-associated protein
VITFRSPAASWSSPPASYVPPPSSPGSPLPSFQTVLEDRDYVYDVVNNPVEIRDWRIPSEWPAGAKPVTQKIQYDDLYRVTRIDHEYSAGDDSWLSPYDAELDGDPAQQDRRRAAPSPHVRFDERVLWQTFDYDWLGNTAGSEDDARGFYDRSLGDVTNASAADKPYQLSGASSGDSLRGGRLATEYDAAGNLTRLDVLREASGSNCLGGASCSQRFAYDWDETGRLVRARRWDVSAASITTPGAPLPSTSPSADLSYQYNAEDQRVLKTARDPSAQTSHTVYVFESLELRRTTYSEAAADYEHSRFTEVPYLFANGTRLARVVWHESAAGTPQMPSLSGARQHVLLELDDHLGSTSVVLDHETGELVERSTFYAYGATESDFRPERWKSFREDYRFTGKEEDVEVGLQYFGKRFLNPLLGRWVSPDPLEVHTPGQADPNVYAYVSGKVLQNVDPLGLSEEGEAFTRTAEAGNNTEALTHLNGLSMTEMLNRLDALGEERRAGLQGMVGSVKGLNSERMSYAFSVVASRTLPAAAPGDLRATGQVSEAASFLAERYFAPVARQANPGAAPHIARILLELNDEGVTDRSHIAYTLATAHHESGTGRYMTEFSSGNQYNNRADLGNTHPGDGPRFRGRGYVQITGRTNYNNYSRLTGENLVANPTRAADPDVAVQVLVHGLRTGAFTGRRLADYGDDATGFNYQQARRTVNAMDRAAAIAALAQRYRSVMRP